MAAPEALSPSKKCSPSEGLFIPGRLGVGGQRMAFALVAIRPRGEIGGGGFLIDHSVGALSENLR